jgi:hypothetical protein
MFITDKVPYVYRGKMQKSEIAANVWYADDEPGVLPPAARDR